MPQHDTPLSGPEEQAFQGWKRQYAPNDSGADYDLRGAFKAGLKPDAKTGHWPDTYKKPNHPTFSNESQYTKEAPEKAGRWVGDTYVPASSKVSLQAGRDFLAGVGKTPSPSRVVPFNSIAKDLDPYMPASQYDNLREQYFWDVVHPSIPEHISRGAALAEFKKQTERPALLTWWEKPLVQTAILANAHSQAVLSPLLDNPLGEPIMQKFRQEQADMVELAQREGLNVALPDLVGSFSGMVLPLLTLEKVAGPVSNMLMRNTQLSAKALSFWSRVSETGLDMSSLGTGKYMHGIATGSLSFGMYNALAEDKGSRVVHGATGLAEGAAYGVTLGLIPFLRSRGVKDPAKVLQDVAQGRPIDPEIDAMLAMKISHDAKSQDLAPYVFSVKEDPRIRTAVQQMRSPEGRTIDIPIEVDRESAAVGRMQQLRDAGWSQGPLTHGSDRAKSVNRFLKMASADAAVPPAEHSILKVAPGQAEGVASRMKGTVIDQHTVAVPKLDKELGSAPSDAEVEAGLDSIFYNMVPTGKGVQNVKPRVGTDKANERQLFKGWLAELWRDDLSPVAKNRIIQNFSRPGSRGGELEPLVPEKYRWSAKQAQAPAVAKDPMSVVKNVLDEYGWLSPKQLQGELELYGAGNADKAHALYEQAAREGLIDYNTGVPKPGAEPKPSTSLPPKVLTPAQKMTVLKKQLEPDQIWKDRGAEILTDDALAQMKALGKQGQLELMSKDQIERTLVERTEHDVVIKQIEQDAAKASQESGDQMTMQELQKLAKNWEYDPTALTEESLELANYAGKSKVVRALMDEQISAAKKGATDKKGQLAEVLQSLYGQASKADQFFAQTARMPESELMAAVEEDLAKLVDRPKAQHVVSSNIEPAGTTLTMPGMKPVMIIRDEAMKDPLIKRQTVYHEGLHVDLSEVDDFDIAGKDARATGLELGKGIAKAVPKTYEGMSEQALLEEAFAHTAAALRTGDNRYLAALAHWDKDVDHVLSFVKTTAEELFNKAFDAGDSVRARSLQRKMGDLIRRSDSDVMFRLREYIGQHGVPDLENGKWVFRTKDSERVLGSLREVHDMLDVEDVSAHQESWTSALEMLGLHHSPMLPGRTIGHTDLEKLPLPETVTRAEDLGLLTASHLYRPLLAWAADAHTAINKLTGTSYLPLFEKMKAVDEGVRESTSRGDTLVNKLWKELSGIGSKKNIDYTMYITQPEAQRPAAAAALKMSMNDVQRADKVWDLIKGDLNELLPGAKDYFERKLPLLRKFDYQPEMIWGKPKTPGEMRSVDFWEQSVRDGTLKTNDEQLSRLLSFMIRNGLNKKYVETPLEELGKLARAKNDQGQFILGAAKWPVDNYMRYVSGQADTSQRIMNNFVRSLDSGFRQHADSINKVLPKKWHIDPKLGTPPQSTINKFMMLQYAGGLALRPIVWIRDVTQALNALPVLGAKDFWKGMETALTSKGWEQAEKEGALLGKHNLGQLWGDIFAEVEPGHPLMDKALALAKRAMEPQRGTNNFGRAVAYHGEYGRALKAIEKYRAGEYTLDQLMDKTSLWMYQDPVKQRLLKMADPRTLLDSPGTNAASGFVEKDLVHLDSKAVAREFALELVDQTQWPFRRGTQPSLLQTGAGRVFGLYGQWPLAQREYLAHLGKLALSGGPAQGRAIKAAVTWSAWNLAMNASFEALGADTSKWYLFSSAAYGPGPTLQAAGNLFRAPEDSPEGKQARKEIIQYPVNFFPGSVAVRSIIRSMEKDEDFFTSEGKPGPGFWRWMGARPVQDLQKDKEIQDWLKDQAGFGNNYTGY